MAAVSRIDCDGALVKGRQAKAVLRPAVAANYFPLIKSAAFSAIAIVGAFVCPVMGNGMTEASITRNLSTPRTR